MQGHTHGRWCVDGHEIKVLRPERAQLGEGAAETVCTMESSLPPAETVANAALIAAAPELLEALRGLLNAPDPDEVEDATPRFRAVMKAHAAIAKATGGTRHA